jgi:hypothetical protein
MNISAFPASLEDRREVRTATGTPGSAKSFDNLLHAGNSRHVRSVLLGLFLNVMPWRSRKRPELPGIRRFRIAATISSSVRSGGLDPKVCRLFIIDGAKALSKVIRRTFGAHTPIQRCQIHKARNVIERLPKPLHASVRRALGAR